MRRRVLGLMSAVVALVLLLTACSGSGTPKQEPKTPEPAPAVQPAKEAVFYGGWPYNLPPKSNFQWYSTATLAMGGSPYNEMMMNPFAMYYWDSDTWEPMLATDWKMDAAKNEVTLNLRKGVKWSDGKDFNATDVINTLSILKANSHAVWRYVDKVTATNDHQVVFHLGQPSTIALRYILKTQPVSSAVYGAIAKKVQALFDAGKAPTSEEVKAVMKEMDTLQPKEFTVTGPYNIDPATMTEAQMTLKKVPTAWQAQTVKFDKIVIYNGETAAITPLVLDKKVDFATHAFPPATEKQILAQNIRVIRYPTYSGPSLFFNMKIYPLDRKEVRQAIAYAVNRSENGMVALSSSGVPVKYMTGFSDNLVKTWMNQADIQKLNQYEYNPTKGAELLTSIGFKKGADGIWVDDKGKPLSFEVHVPSDYADWSASAENAVQQLNKFGIKAVVRGVPSSQAPTDINQGKFQIGFRLFGSSVPHPSFGFTADLVTYNQAQHANKTELPGQNYPLKQKWSGGDIDFNAMITESAAGLDVAKQKEIIGKTALALNELMPIVPLYERYTNSPALENVHVTGWPKDGDPILKNGGGDNFVTLMILTGKLSPAK
ncbi:MAG TPA: ABC transporter substrate-binding protein [Symbiobacteriaceae bacterium]|nr:ABC transporter substrate-binding protein [Symbiobacteriaceae bacterium]